MDYNHELWYGKSNHENIKLILFLFSPVDVLLHSIIKGVILIITYHWLLWFLSLFAFLIAERVLAGDHTHDGTGTVLFFS